MDGTKSFVRTYYICLLSGNKKPLVLNGEGRRIEQENGTIKRFDWNSVRRISLHN